VRGRKGDKKSLLQAFQPLLVIVTGRHELRNVNHIEAAGNMLNLAGNQLFSAMYINELLNRVLPKEVPHPELYHLYLNTLNQLKSDSHIEPILREFESSLLNDLGYGLDLSCEYDTQLPIEKEYEYCVIPEQGLQRIAKPVAGSNRFNGQALLHMQQQQWNENSLHCAKRINRMSLSHLLGHKPLKSRELFLTASQITSKR
jgi:DNA repair protein RecO (recombination protein O)